MDRRTLAGAGFYGVLGAVALIRPSLVPPVFGGTAPTASSRTEVRAVYGGLPLAMAVTITMERGEAPRPMTAAMALLSGGMAVGRLTGMLVERETDVATATFAILEVATALALGSSAGGGGCGRPGR